MQAIYDAKLLVLQFTLGLALYRSKPAIDQPERKEASRK